MSCDGLLPAKQAVYLVIFMASAELGLSSVLPITYVQYPPLISDNPSLFLEVSHKPMICHLIWLSSTIRRSGSSSVQSVSVSYVHTFEMAVLPLLLLAAS